jgi:hypothetical protein
VSSASHLGWTAVGIVSLVYGIADVFGIRLRTPSRNWQIPQNWGAWGYYRLMLAFGFALGLGFLTVVNFVGYYILIAACVLSGSVWLSTLAMTVYGVGRAIPSVIVAREYASREGRMRQDNLCPASVEM